MIQAIITILSGILAASGFFIARKPNAKELIDKITPYQGWVGVIVFLWGVWQTICVILNLGWIAHNLLFWIAWAVLAFANMFVGFLLGFGLITKYALSKNEEAMEKGQRIRGKLVKYQIPLGFISIGIGLLYLLWSMGLFLFGYIGLGVIIIAYIILVLVAGKPKVGDSNEDSSSAPSAAAQKQNASTAITALKGGIYYENRISNVSCTQVGAVYKVSLTITAKKFVVDAKTGKAKEEMINDEIQIGMLKGDKEIYLKSYKFTKTITSLSLSLDQKPDKIGIDPYNKLQERA
jgi:hypothetical protein